MCFWVILDRFHTLLGHTGTALRNSRGEEVSLEEKNKGSQRPGDMPQIGRAHV